MKRFSEFLGLYPDRYADLRMWHYSAGERSSDYPPAAITEERANAGTFIFLGERQRMGALNYDRILAVFDRLLPLYEYVEGGPTAQPVEAPGVETFNFRPGCPARSKWAKASLAQRQLDIQLRHNELQVKLYRRLVELHGEENVGVEIENGTGGKIDVVVKTDDGFWIYEIKTGASARGCIREAIGQLLEYSLWPGAQMTSKLIIVGEGPLDVNAKTYLHKLNDRFSPSIEL